MSNSMVLTWSAFPPEGYKRVYEGVLEVTIAPEQAKITASLDKGSGIAPEIAREFKQFADQDKTLKFDRARFTLEDGRLGLNGKTLLPFKIYVRLI